MIHLNLPRNTAYNPMIYITFFIVILIDKRGVREAERGGKARTTEHHTIEHRYEHRYEHRTIQRTIQRTIPSGKEKGMSGKEACAHNPTPHHTAAHHRHTTPHTVHTTPQDAPPHRTHPATTQPPTGTCTRARPRIRSAHARSKRARTRARALIRAHGGARARSG